MRWRQVEAQQSEMLQSAGAFWGARRCATKLSSKLPLAIMFRGSLGHIDNLHYLEVGRLPLRPMVTCIQDPSQVLPATKYATGASMYVSARYCWYVICNGSMTADPSQKLQVRFLFRCQSVVR